MRNLKINSIFIPGSRLYWFVSILLFVAVIAFGLFYILSGYTYLVQWFTGLNDCFYRSKEWPTDFFTPRTKSDGDRYGAIAIVVAFCGLIYSAKRFLANSKNRKTVAFQIKIWDALFTVAIIAASLLFWLWGYKLSLPSYDEVFTAQNVAGIHPFQAVSYYMLPNNHLFFNLINSLVFHAFNDKVVSGRIISLLAYSAFMCVVFFWLQRLMQNRLLAFLASVTLALQFQVWGFSFQARGYELYLLAEWGMMISLFCYLQSGRKDWLYLNVLCVCIGYFCLPSFLYFHIATCVFMAAYQLLYKQASLLFWKYQVAAFLITFLCYLPALCFSGADAIAHNNYVAPMSGYKSIPGFAGWMFPAFTNYITHLFSNLHWYHFSFNIFLFIAPVLLALDKKNKLNRLYGMFYISCWIVFFIMVLTMKRMPFERNLIGHYSFTLCGIILTAYWFSGLAYRYLQVNIARNFFFPAVLTLLALHFARTNSVYLKDTLYEYEVNYYYSSISKGLSYIPGGSTVSISDQGFYAGYISMKQGCKLAKCPTGREDYFIKRKGEPLPPLIQQNYALLKTNYSNDIYDYEIYKIK
jgi:hypothetical protein